MVEPMMINHAELKQRIRQCERVDEFEQVYNSAAFQCALRAIHVAQGIAPVDEWSTSWAIHMRAGDFNECRRTALTFVFELCNRWMDDACEGVTDESLVMCIMGHRMSNILQLVLPMERAQALYEIMFPGRAAHGGVSEGRAEQSIGSTTPSERPFWSMVDGKEQIEAALATVRRYLSAINAAAVRDGTIDDGLAQRL
jgi:hypothetical protein